MSTLSVWQKGRGAGGIRRPRAAPSDATAFWRPLLQYEQAPSGITFEIGEANGVSPDKALDRGSRAVARLQQDHFRRSAPRDTQARKILVFRQEREPVGLRIFPNDCIGGAAQFGGADVN